MKKTNFAAVKYLKNHMKKTILFIALFAIWFNSKAQIIAEKINITDDIPEICVKEELYLLINVNYLTGEYQKEAFCLLTKEQIVKKLNEEVKFLKRKSKYNDSGTAAVVINCNGKQVWTKMEVKTKSQKLDKQIEGVFNLLGQWSAGNMNGKEVDSYKRYRFSIKNGKFILE